MAKSGNNDFGKEEAAVQAQGFVMQLQAYRDQQQALLMQRQQIEIALAEISSALEALKKTEEGKIYRAIGPIMVKKDRIAVESDLSEMSETSKIRLATVKKQEEKVKEKIKELTEKIAPLMKQAGFEP